MQPCAACFPGQKIGTRRYIVSAQCNGPNRARILWLLLRINRVQDLQDILGRARSFFSIHLQHLLQQGLEPGRNGGIDLRGGPEEKWTFAGIQARQ